MNVVINGITYENVLWSGNTLELKTNMTLSEIENAFQPDLEANIVLFEGDQEVARYYNKGIDRIIVSGISPRTVNVVFKVTQIDEGAETEIRESMETSDEAIIELAELISEITEDTVQTNAAARLRNLENWMADMMRVSTEPGGNGFIASIHARLDRLEEAVFIDHAVEEE